MLISLFVFACQIEEHVDTDFAERVGLSGNSHDDEQKNTLKHGNKAFELSYIW